MIVCISLGGTVSKKSEGWKGLVPLRSARADVERLLGPSVEQCTSLCKYKTSHEIIFARYSSMPCGNDETDRWRVPSNTLIELSLNLEETPKLSSLKLNLKKFKRTLDPELHGYSNYENEQEGIAYSVSDDKRVYSIHFFPNMKNERTLSCR